jgi:uncharacterized protein YbjT (DUF2867 family)
MGVHCLVIGATGYVGARLVRHLLDEGHTVRCLVRNRAKLARHTWVDRVEVRQGDVNDADAVRDACDGIDAVFYLVHSMDGPDFADRDRRAVAVLADAAHTAGVQRIVYLGGLQPTGDENSEHLASRREVGEILMASHVPTAVLQAGIVVGAGSASYEMIRHLTEASPLLPMPDHAWNAVQPIGIDDVLYHLVACLQLPSSVNRTFDIGGPDVLSFRELILGYAEVAGLTRPLTVPVPLSAPRMISRAVQALTPVDRHLAKPLVESMAHDLVAHGDPPAGPPPGGATPYAEAVRRAVAGEGAAGRGPTDLHGVELVSEQTERVKAPPAVLWDVISTIGGENGWYNVPGIWALRGGIDRLFGGVGARRGRPGKLEPGAQLDWWIVEDVQDGRSLTLRAETKMPGTARLEMRVEPDGDGSRYVQRVTFTPRGIAGRAYWYAELPAHDFVFAVMARTIAGVAATRARRAAGTRGA